MNERIIELEAEILMWKKKCKDMEHLATFWFSQVPATKATKTFKILESLYQMIKSNLTLIVFLNGITLFGYGLSELL